MRFCNAIVFVLSLTGSFSAMAAEQSPDQPDTQIASVVRANTTFALDLFRKLSIESADKNLFCSPYSVTTALAMAAEGARGQTANEMLDGLHLADWVQAADDVSGLRQWNMRAAHQGLAALQRRFAMRSPEELAPLRRQIETLRAKLQAAQQRTADALKSLQPDALNAARKDEQNLANRLNELLTQVDQYEIRIANTLWGERTYPFGMNYLQTIEAFYGKGALRAVDFKSRPEATRREINQWAEQQTNRRIKNLVPPGAIDQDSRLVLANAIYFRGDWAEPFSAGKTHAHDFTQADGKVFRAAMMKADKLENASYAAFNADGSYFTTPKSVPVGPGEGEKPDASYGYPGPDGFAMLELPYKGDELAMILIAPNRPDRLPALERQFSTANLERWISRLQQRDVHVFLPRFKLESQFELNETLQKLGMVRAFVDPRKPNGAEFQGMTVTADPQLRLYIAKVAHKAFVEVNEKGTEAAAATAVAFAVVVSARVDPNFTPTFKADRPFLFLIRDRVTGTVLFVGRVMQPDAAGDLPQEPKVNAS